MASIGEQIRNARKAKGITQDALAESMNVTRAAVSNWEQDRRLPDADTLLRLSKTLDYSFESESSLISDESATEGTETAAEPVSGVPAAGISGIIRKPLAKTIIVIACAAVILTACLIVILCLTSRGSVRERYYKSPVDGGVYTIERFQQETPNEAGKAYLRIVPSLKINPGENYDFWLFDFDYHEMNGISLNIDRIEHVYFSRDKENVEMIYTAADISAFGLPTEIPAYGEWTYSGGLPIQDTVLGVGVLLRGTDANGAALTFTGYISFK